MGKEPVTISTGMTVTDGAITMLKNFVTFCAVELESWTVTASENVPDCEGLPVICPKEETRETPDGNEPEVIDHA